MDSLFLMERNWRQGIRRRATRFSMENVALDLVVYMIIRHRKLFLNRNGIPQHSLWRTSELNRRRSPEQIKLRWQHYRRLRLR